MSELRLGRTLDGRIVRETDREAAFFIGYGTEADLTRAPVEEPKPEKAPVKAPAKKAPTRRKG